MGQAPGATRIKKTPPERPEHPTKPRGDGNAIWAVGKGEIPHPMRTSRVSLAESKNQPSG